MEQDLELVKRCLAGEDSGWEALLRAHTSKVYNLCYRFTSSGAQAEDLTQEVFIKIYQTLRSFDATQGTFTTWLNRIARNHLVDHYRRTKKDRVTDSIEDKVERVEEKPSRALDPMGALESREVRELLQAALAMLSPEMREAVIL
ncbi:MAG: RNA polymerase sigma factor, partial [Terriglobia bacterium]